MINETARLMIHLKYQSNVAMDGGKLVKTVT